MVVRPPVLGIVCLPDGLVDPDSPRGMCGQLVDRPSGARCAYRAVSASLRSGSYEEMDKHLKEVKDIRNSIGRMGPAVEAGATSILQAKSMRAKRKEAEKEKQDKEARKAAEKADREKAKEQNKLLDKARRDADASMAAPKVASGVFGLRMGPLAVQARVLDTVDRCVDVSSPFVLVKNQGFLDLANLEPFKFAIADFLRDAQRLSVVRDKRRGSRSLPAELGSKFHSATLESLGSAFLSMPEKALPFATGGSMFTFLPDLAFIGTEFLAIPGARLFLDGECEYIIVAYETAGELVSRHTPGAKYDQLQQLLDLIGEIGSQAAFEAVGRDSIFRATLTKGMLLFTPAGFVTIVRTLNSTQPFGIRISLFTANELDSLRSMRSILQSSGNVGLSNMTLYLDAAAKTAPGGQVTASSTAATAAKAVKAAEGAEGEAMQPAIADALAEADRTAAAAEAKQAERAVEEAALNAAEEAADHTAEEAATKGEAPQTARVWLATHFRGLL